MKQRLSVRFNDDEKHYKSARWVRIDYENGDYLSVEHKPSGEVISEFKPSEEDINKDGRVWKIEPNDEEHYFRLSIDNKFWIIEKWKVVQTEQKVLHKYARTMKNVVTTKVVHV